MLSFLLAVRDCGALWVDEMRSHENMLPPHRTPPARESYKVTAWFEHSPEDIDSHKRKRSTAKAGFRCRDMLFYARTRP
jgi:hypothetical protein